MYFVQVLLELGSRAIWIRRQTEDGIGNVYEEQDAVYPERIHCCIQPEQRK